MDKGQHLRLVIMGTESTPSANFIGLATDLTFHLSAQTEDSTTKDSTDTNGSWNSYDVVSRSGDIQFGALLASKMGDYQDANGYYLEELIDMISDTEIDWKLVAITAGSTNNRTIAHTICYGKGKITNLQISAQNRQKGTFSGTINLFGPVSVAED